MIQHILGDIMNLAYIGCKNTPDGRIPRYENVRRFKGYFYELKQVRSHPITYHFIADASLIHKIDDPVRLRWDIERGVVLECPARSTADEFMLEFLNQHPNDTIIVSNDTFKDHPAPETRRAKWRYPAMVLQGETLVPGLVGLLEAECPPQYERPAGSPRAASRVLVEHGRKACRGDINGKSGTVDALHGNRRARDASACNMGSPGEAGI